MARWSLSARGGTPINMCLAIPGEVLSTHDKSGVVYANVRFGGVTREVCVHAFPDVAIGEFVLVHVGFAIAKIDRAEAARAWQLLLDLGELERDGDMSDNDFDEPRDRDRDRDRSLLSTLPPPPEVAGDP